MPSVGRCVLITPTLHPFLGSETGVHLVRKLIIGASPLLACAVDVVEEGASYLLLSDFDGVCALAGTLDTSD